MFSKACEYAIRAVMFVAQKSKDGTKIGIKEIAKGIDSPEHFVAKILQDLSRKGLIQSQKGPSGGFYLDDRSLKAPLADIVRTVDGDTLFTVAPSASGNARKQNPARCTRNSKRSATIFPTSCKTRPWANSARSSTGTASSSNGKPGSNSAAAPNGHYKR